MITDASIQNKEVDELTMQEMSYVHLSSNYGPIVLKSHVVRSTLSFLHENISHSLLFEYSKQLIPYIGLCSMLEQLGTCYDRIDIVNPKFSNNLKRALVIFGDLNVDDELIDVIYALRNGLLHNASLTSYDRKKKKFYHFLYNYNLEGIYKKSSKEWDGNYETLDNSVLEYTSSINVYRLKDFVFECVHNAYELNQSGKLSIRLNGGIRQLYFDYIRAIPKLEKNEYREYN